MLCYVNEKKQLFSAELSFDEVEIENIVLTLIYKFCFHI